MAHQSVYMPEFVTALSFLYSPALLNIIWSPTTTTTKKKTLHNIFSSCFLENGLQMINFRPFLIQKVSLARRFALVPLGPPLLAYCSNCKAMLTAVDGAVQLVVDRPYKAGESIVVW